MIDGPDKFQAIREQLIDELDLRQYEIENDPAGTLFTFKIFVGEHDGQPYRVIFQKESKRDIARKALGLEHEFGGAMPSIVSASPVPRRCEKCGELVPNTTEGTMSLCLGEKAVLE